MGANVPLFERLNVPMGAIFACIFFFAALAELGRQGIIKPSHLTNVVVVLYTSSGIGEGLIVPQPTLASFGFTDLTALTMALFVSYSALKLQLGLFLLISKMTGKQGLGIVASMAVGIANCSMFIMSADK